MIVSRESKVTGGGKGCSGCGGRRDRPGQRYCRKCHRAYMRGWRQGKVTRLLTPEQWAAVDAALAAVSR